MTLVVNLYGGPGTGKSTTAAGVFANLKANGINCELVHEFAKDLTWEKRDKALAFQPYVMGKQLWKIQKLLGQVDCVISDSPILLGLLYATVGMPDSWTEFLVDINHTFDNLDIYLKRGNRPYNPKGRNQTHQEAIELDKEIKKILNWESKIPGYKSFHTNDIDGIVIEVQKALHTRGLF